MHLGDISQGNHQHNFLPWFQNNLYLWTPNRFSRDRYTEKLNFLKCAHTTSCITARACATADARPQSYVIFQGKGENANTAKSKCSQLHPHTCISNRPSFYCDDKTWITIQMLLSIPLLNLLTDFFGAIQKASSVALVVTIFYQVMFLLING